MLVPDTFMVFDVESFGLHGEGFAVGWVVVDRHGDFLEEGSAACPIYMTEPLLGTEMESAAWLQQNLPVIATQYSRPEDMRSKFWSVWQLWKQEGAMLAADVPWPVEARFLRDCITCENCWQGPYPLIDIATLRLAAGLDPLAVTDRLPSELPVHDPLADARQSARHLTELLRTLKLW